MCTAPPSVIEQILARPDGELASATIGAMSVSPSPENFAALGRVLRRGIEAGGREDFEAALLRRGRRR